MKEKMPRHFGVLEGRIEKLQDNPDHPEAMSRRDMLIASGMNLASLAAATSIVGKAALDESHKGSIRTPKNDTSEIHAFKPAQTENLKEDPNWWRDIWYKTPKELVGKNLSDEMEWSYIKPDLPEEVKLVNPASLPRVMPPIAFHNNLAELLDKKKRRSQSSVDAAHQARVYESLKESYEELYINREVRKMDLKGFRAIIEQESHVVLADLQKKRPEIMRNYIEPYLDKTQWKHGESERKRYEAVIGKCLEQLAERITPDIMLAYITTELMPAPDKGLPLLEFLTLHGGLEFVERIPALGDNELSFGPLQLTPYVVGEHGSVTNLQRVMHSHLIPNSLEEFSSIEDHLRAGFLFAFTNILHLVQDLCAKGKYEELITILEGENMNAKHGRSSVFLEFISAAHHRPESARRAMDTWLHHNKSLPKAERAVTLSSSFSSTAIDQEDRKYAERSRHFLERIQKV